MAEYIEREAVKAAVRKRLNNSLIIGWLISIINDCPAADVAPVRPGRWIEPPRLYYGAKQYECSLCYSDTFWNKHSITEKYLHCPNCGAKMDLEV